MGEIAKRNGTPSAWAATDRSYGFGYGKYGGSEEFVHVIKLTAETNARFYVMDAATATMYTFNAAATEWTELSVTNQEPWRFTQFDKWIIGASTNGGLIKKDITQNTQASLSGMNVRVGSIIKNAGVAALLVPPLTNYAWLGTDTQLAYTEFGYGATATSISGGSLIYDYAGAGSPSDTRVWLGADFTTAKDWRTSRYIAFTAEIFNWSPPAAGREQETPNFNGTYGNTNVSEVLVYWTDDVAAVAGTWTNWYSAKCQVTYTEGDPFAASGLGRPKKALVRVDLEFFRDANLLDAVEKIMVGIPFASGDAGQIRLGPIQIGGTFMGKPTAGSSTINNYLLPDSEKVYGDYLNPIVYRIQSYNTATFAESAPSDVMIDQVDALGNTTYGLMGSKVTVTYPAPSGAFDRTRVWRKRWSDSEKWYLLGEFAAGGTLTDSLVDWTGDITAWPATTRTKDAKFGGVGDTTGLKPQALAVWKQHLVLGVGADVYFSAAQRIDEFVQPLRDTIKIGEIDTEDVTQARTLYLSSDQSDKAIGFVSKDILYAIGQRGIYAMIGDNAIQATPFRALPGSMGALGDRAFCPYRDGLIVACSENLYYVEATRAFALSSDSSTYSITPLTLDIPVSYKSFLAAYPDNPVIVREHEDEILICRGSRFLRGYLPTGSSGGFLWEEGDFNHFPLELGKTGSPTATSVGAAANYSGNYAFGPDIGSYTTSKVQGFGDASYLDALAVAGLVQVGDTEASATACMSSALGYGLLDYNLAWDIVRSYGSTLTGNWEDGSGSFITQLTETSGLMGSYEQPAGLGLPGFAAAGSYTSTFTATGTVQATWKMPAGLTDKTTEIEFLLWCEISVNGKYPALHGNPAGYAAVGLSTTFTISGYTTETTILQNDSTYKKYRKLIRMPITAAHNAVFSKTATIAATITGAYTEGTIDVKMYGKFIRKACTGSASGVGAPGIDNVIPTLTPLEAMEANGYPI